LCYPTGFDGLVSIAHIAGFNLEALHAGKLHYQGVEVLCLYLAVFVVLDIKHAALGLLGSTATRTTCGNFGVGDDIANGKLSGLRLASR